jgi:hypothetical protein
MMGVRTHPEKGSPKNAAVLTATGKISVCKNERGKETRKEDKIKRPPDI